MIGTITSSNKKHYFEGKKIMEAEDRILSMITLYFC